MYAQICHENIAMPLDGAYLADFGINISCSCTTATYFTKHEGSGYKIQAFMQAQKNLWLTALPDHTHTRKHTEETKKYLREKTIFVSIYITKDTFT